MKTSKLYSKMLKAKVDFSNEIYEKIGSFTRKVHNVRYVAPDSSLDCHFADYVGIRP